MNLLQKSYLFVTNEGIIRTNQKELLFVRFSDCKAKKPAVEEKRGKAVCKNKNVKPCSMGGPICGGPAFFCAVFETKDGDEWMSETTNQLTKTDSLPETEGHAVKAISMMMIITLVGKVLGLVRDQFLAGNYAVGMEADAFLTASRIPRIFFDVVFASAISASFIPVFTEYLGKKGKKEAYTLSHRFITLIGVLTLAVTVLGIGFAPLLTELFADGFDAETAALCTRLLRILFPATFFTGLAFCFVGLLQSMDEFNVPAAMSIASNVVIILYYVFFNDTFGIYGLTVAFLIGWAMQALMQVPALIKKGYYFRLDFHVKGEGMKKIVALMLPVMVSTWVQPINLAINTKYASRLLEGGVSVVEYANTVYSIIVGVFVLSVANVIFPKLSRLQTNDDTQSFGKTVGTTMEVMSYLLLPMTAGLMCLSIPVIRLIYQRGAFDDAAAQMTGQALFFFTMGMMGYGLQTILSRAFYARQEGRAPLLSGLVSIVLNLLLCAWLSPRMGVSGLALSSTLSLTISALLLVIPMQKQGKVITRGMLWQVLKMFVAAVLMAVVVLGCKRLLEQSLGTNFFGTLLLVAIPTAVGVLVYFVLTLLFRVPYAKMALEYGRNFLQRKVER